MARGRRAIAGRPRARSPLTRRARSPRRSRPPPRRRSPWTCREGRSRARSPRRLPGRGATPKRRCWPTISRFAISTAGARPTSATRPPSSPRSTAGCREARRARRSPRGARRHRRGGRRRARRLHREPRVRGRTGRRRRSLALYPGDVAPLLGDPARRRGHPLRPRRRQRARARRGRSRVGHRRRAGRCGSPPPTRSDSTPPSTTGSASRGEGERWSSLSLLLGAESRGLVADVAVAETGRASRAVREGLDALTQIRAIHDPLAEWLHVRDVRFGGSEVPGGGRASTATFVAEHAPRSSPRGLLRPLLLRRLRPRTLAIALGEAAARAARAAAPWPRRSETTRRCARSSRGSAQSRAPW